MESRVTLAFVVLSISCGLLYWAWTSVDADGGAPPPLTETDLADDEMLLEFERLASYTFDYETPKKPGGPETGIPDEILALHGEKVAIQGHFSPILDEQDRVTEGMLSRYPGACCFGQFPLITEIVWVKMKQPELMAFAWDATVLVRGTFKVEVVRNRFGYVEHIYGIDADVVEDRTNAAAR